MVYRGKTRTAARLGLLDTLRGLTLVEMVGLPRPVGRGKSGRLGPCLVRRLAGLSLAAADLLELHPALRLLPAPEPPSSAPRGQGVRGGTSGHGRDGSGNAGGCGALGDFDVPGSGGRRHGGCAAGAGAAAADPRRGGVRRAVRPHPQDRRGGAPGGGRHAGVAVSK